MVTDFILTLVLLDRRPARGAADRSSVPTRGARIPTGPEVLVVGAGSGGQMVVRELQLNPNLGADARSASSTTIPRKRGMSACWG